MPKIGRICIELPFNRNISYSQRQKTKGFWHFLDNETNLRPYQIPSDKDDTKDDDADQSPPLEIRGMWHDQFKEFQKHGLDKTALAAREHCRMCSTKFIPRPSSCTDNMEQSYEELQRDMQAFDKKLNPEEIDSTDTIGEYSFAQ